MCLSSFLSSLAFPSHWHWAACVLFLYPAPRVLILNVTLLLADGPRWALPYQSFIKTIFHRLHHRLFWSGYFSEGLFFQVTPGCIKLTVTSMLITFYFILMEVLGIEARSLHMLVNSNHYYQHLTLWDLRLKSYILTIHRHKHTFRADGAATVCRWKKRGSQAFVAHL